MELTWDFFFKNCESPDPFQIVVTDLFKNGYKYLARDDRLTCWIELVYFRQDPHSSDIIDSTTTFFSHDKCALADHLTGSIELAYFSQDPHSSDNTFYNSIPQ